MLEALISGFILGPVSIILSLVSALYRNFVWSIAYTKPTVFESSDAGELATRANLFIFFEQVESVTSEEVAL